MIFFVDPLPIIRDLNGWGWRDYKIEIACGLGAGYIAQVKSGGIKVMAHKKVVPLYNFWETEAVARGVEIPPYGAPSVSREPVQTRLDHVTT